MISGKMQGIIIFWNMTSPNAWSHSPESPETPVEKKHVKWSLSGLLKEGISRTLGEPIDPIKFNAFKQNNWKVADDVRQHMKDLRKAKMEDWEGVEEKEIVDLKEKQIWEQVLYYSKDLVYQRKKTFDRIVSTYPAIKDVANWESTLTQYLDTLDREELVKHGTQKHQMKKALSAFPDTVTMNPRDKYNFELIFSDLDTIGATPVQKARIQKIHQYYMRHSSYPDSMDMTEILSIYRNAPAKRKLEILSDFQTDISIKFASDNHLISDQYLESFTENTFWALYTSLDKEEKDAFIRNLKWIWGDEVMISARNIDLWAIDPVFSDAKKLKKIGESIVRSLGISSSKETDTNADSIPAKMRALGPKDEDGNSLDHDMLDTFKLLIKKELRSADNSKCLVNGIEDMGVGSVLMFGDEENPRYFRIKQSTDENGLPLDVDNGGESWVCIEWLPIEDGVIQGRQPKLLTYTDFYQFLRNSTSDVKVISKEAFDAKLTNNSKDAGIEWKIFDATTLEDEVTSGNIVAKIDTLDATGREFGFEEGTYFEAPEEEKNGKADKKIWKVVKVHGNFVDIMAPGGTKEENIPLEIILNIAKAGKFKRIAKITDDHSLISALSKDCWLSDHAHVEWSDFVEEHEEHGKKQKHTIKCFSWESGHIRIGGIEDGIVHFWEYNGEGTEKAKAYAEKHGANKAQKAFYQPKSLTYWAFLDYLKSHDLTASSDDILDPHAAHADHDEHHHPHLETSWLSKIWKMQSISSMWKGMEMIWHSLEHTLEKGSDLDAARFAMSASKFMPFLGDGVQAQIYADIVDKSKGIVEKYKNKIGNLMGPAQRLKCIHIAHNKDSRPEEVVAAIQFMVSSYGHLYAEDIRHYQSVVTKPRLATSPEGTYSFLDAFIRSTKMPGGDGKPPYIYWRLKAYEKAIPEMGDGKKHEGEPTEEQLLHALFKSIDGNPEKYPYAGSVVKAIWGPGGFEKDWKFEWFDNAYEKGKKQTTMVNAQWRLNKAIWYLSAHEIYKAIGGMEQVAGKMKTPEFQAFPFVWAVWGYTKFASPTALQKLKGYTWNGISFHAYSFLREDSDNMLYRDTVRLALQELERQWKIKSEDIAEFDRICKRFDHGPESADVVDKKYNKVTAPVAMMKFWQDHCNTGLSDMLQNKDGWLTAKAKSDKTVERYRNKLIGTHQEKLSDSGIPSGEATWWYDEHGYNNLIMGDKDGLKSLERNLIKIQFKWPNRWWRPMDPDHDKKIWQYITKYMNGWLRNTQSFLWDEDLQRKQFLFHREEIINYFAASLNASEVKDQADISRLIKAKEYRYFQDIASLGIDPRAIFNPRLAKENAEKDYQAWKKGGIHARKIGVDDVIGDIETRVSWAQMRHHSSKPLHNDEFRDTDDDPKTAWHSSWIPYRSDD